MKSIQQLDPGLSTLLDLHGQVLDQGDGYWIKMEAWRVEVSAHIPHGVRYTLTLHEPYGKRILGYCNEKLINSQSCPSSRKARANLSLNVAKPPRRG